MLTQITARIMQYPIKLTSKKGFIKSPPLKLPSKGD